MRPHGDSSPRRTRGAHAAEGGRAQRVRPTLALGTPRDSSPDLGPQTLLSAAGQDPNWPKNRNKTTYSHVPQRPPQPARYSEDLATEEIQLSRAESCELKGALGAEKGAGTGGQWAGPGAGPLRRILENRPVPSCGA